MRNDCKASLMTLKNQNWVLKFGFILDVLCTQSKLNIQTQIFTYINFNFTLNQQLGGWILDTCGCYNRTMIPNTNTHEKCFLEWIKQTNITKTSQFKQACWWLPKTSGEVPLTFNQKSVGANVYIYETICIVLMLYELKKILNEFKLVHV